MRYLSKKNILIISPEPWDGLHVSKHHYATRLAKNGNDVYFLGPPSGTYGIKAEVKKNLSLLYYKKFIPGLASTPDWFVKMQIQAKFKRLEKLAGCRFDVVWSFDNSVFFNFDAISRPRLCISHIVDLNQNFQLVKAASTAHICFGTTEYIIKRLKAYNPATFKVTHGYNHISSKNSSITLPGSNKIKVLYAGNLAMRYLDWKIIDEGIKANPHCDFIFIGSNKEKIDLEINPYHRYKQKVLANTNAIFLNPVESNELPDYYNAADILLIAYQEAHHDDQANPHKMMEYLASGKVVVCTQTSEFEFMQPFLKMSNRNSEWTSNLSEVINHLEQWNTPKFINTRKSYANNNTYEKQLDRIDELILQVHPLLQT